MPPTKEDFRRARHTVKLNDANWSSLKMEAEREDMTFNQVLARWRDDAALVAFNRQRICPECSRPITGNHCTHCQQKGI
jgi:predicted DNA-binding ribbon-helix-helix protein